MAARRAASPWEDRESVSSFDDLQEESDCSAGLEVVCAVAPRFVAMDNGSAVLVEAVGSALKKVSSKIGMTDLGPPLGEHRPLRNVQTLPTALCGACEPDKEDADDSSRLVRQISLKQQGERLRPALKRRSTIDGESELFEGRRGLGLGRRFSCHWGRDVSEPSSSSMNGSAPPPKTIHDLGLPPLLWRRDSRGSGASLASQSGSPQNASVGAGVSQTSSGNVGGLSGALGEAACSNMSIAELAINAESAAESKCSILDFEHLFLQYYVEVRPNGRCSRFVSRLSRVGRSAAGLRRHVSRKTAVPYDLPSSAEVDSAPSAEAIVSAWKAEAVECLWRHRKVCQSRWPELKFSRRSLARRLEEDLEYEDCLHGPRSRVVLTFAPECVCHRLLWAMGDAMPFANILAEIQNGLRDRLGSRFPRYHVRCTDDFSYPPSCFRTLFLVLSVLFVYCAKILLNAIVAFAAWDAQHRSRGKKQELGPSREERLDQLAARILLTGAVAQLWMLHAIALGFPLRSLHSPFKRDLGCLTAYSSTALRLARFVAPVLSLATPVAMAVRFDRLGLALIIPRAGRPAGLHCAALFGAACLPILTAAASWSVRSSFFSHHHLFIMLLFLGNLGAICGFVAYFELVKWAVIALGSAVAFALYLFSMYTAEFTSVSLHKAAQLQWACAHMIPFLKLVLAAALEVEGGAARAIIEYICTSQEIIPVTMCVRLLSNS